MSDTVENIHEDIGDPCLRPYHKESNASYSITKSRKSLYCRFSFFPLFFRYLFYNSLPISVIFHCLHFLSDGSSSLA